MRTERIVSRRQAHVMRQVGERQVQQARIQGKTEELVIKMFADTELESRWRSAGFPATNPAVF
jgi:hypothetical protein